jgi:hypothetical protein
VQPHVVVQEQDDWIASALETGLAGRGETTVTVVLDQANAFAELRANPSRSVVSARILDDDDFGLRSILFSESFASCEYR